jgi:hypothetical protein
LYTRSLCVMLEELANVAWGTKVTSRGAEPVANGLRKRMRSEASLSPLYHGLARGRRWLVELEDQGDRLCAVVD